MSQLYVRLVDGGRTLRRMYPTRFDITVRFRICLYVVHSYWIHTNGTISRPSGAGGGGRQWLAVFGQPIQWNGLVPGARVGHVGLGVDSFIHGSKGQRGSVLHKTDRQQ